MLHSVAYSDVRIIGDVNELLVEHLNYVTDACIVDDDETIPNYSTQWIAYSCGKMATTINI